MERSAGILLPVSSLPSKYGIGCFSREAYEFVDFLSKAGQSFWQVLPLGPTGFGNSPYQPLSSFAGNPYFIDPETLVQEGLLTYEECGRFYFGADEERVDYGALYENRKKLLAIAGGRFFESGREKEEYRKFMDENAYWLPDYALFMAVKTAHNGQSWLQFDDTLKKREPAALSKAREEYGKEIAQICFEQYEFDRQWKKLHTYALQQGVRIIGDVPYYAAMDSSDVWAHPEAFDFDGNIEPVSVAGCPPDAFSKTGQLWGNPVYDWNAQKKTHYAFWISRLQRGLSLYDVIRIDHFLGFSGFYAFPYGAESAENGGEYRKGPGMAFFKEVKKQLGKVPFIAEDLGTVTKNTEKLLADAGIPGMKVLEFAFDWSEYSSYMTHNHTRNCVVYTGTHDNLPVRAWIESLNDHDRDLARRYIHSENTDYNTFTWDFIREAYRSSADLCVIPLQDYLVKGAESRINTPGTQEGNWQWRLKPHFLSYDLAMSIHALSGLYCRLPKPKENADA